MSNEVKGQLLGAPKGWNLMHLIGNSPFFNLSITFKCMDLQLNLIGQKFWHRSSK